MKLINLLLTLTIISTCAFSLPVYAASHKPPALSIANFVKYKLSLKQCEQKAENIIAQMNFNPQKYGAGTIKGMGEQSAISVDCHQLQDSLFIQIVVASQRPEVADIIKNYLLDYLRADTEKLSNPPCLHPSDH
jgi:hypothetical protein